MQTQPFIQNEGFACENEVGFPKQNRYLKTKLVHENETAGRQRHRFVKTKTL